MAQRQTTAIVSSAREGQLYCSKGTYQLSHCTVDKVASTITYVLLMNLSTRLLQDPHVLVLEMKKKIVAL